MQPLVEIHPKKHLDLSLNKRNASFGVMLLDLVSRYKHDGSINAVLAYYTPGALAKAMIDV